MENQQPHRLQFGPYITLKIIGGSEISSVYAAMHETTGEMVALRAMTVTAKNVGKALEDCLDVLNELAEVQVPNAVQIQDFGYDDTILYIAMTILNGGTLLDRMTVRLTDQENPELPSPHEILEMTERLCVALDALHERGMVHGQIQPHSIMFNDRGKSFLTEIGLTRIFKIIYSLEATNSFKMTRYSPPELWSGDRPSPSTDQYALACIVYQLLTGKVPFDGSSIFGIMEAHQNDVAAPPHYIRKGLPSDLAMVFWQALAKPVDRRYPNMRAFYQELQECFRDYQSQPTDFFTFLLD